MKWAGPAIVVLLLVGIGVSLDRMVMVVVERPDQPMADTHSGSVWLCGGETRKIDNVFRYHNGNAPTGGRAVVIYHAGSQSGWASESDWESNCRPAKD